MGGPEIVNFTSMVFASDSTSRLSSPLRMRVPPPAAPPRSELMTTHPSASVSLSFHSKTISGRFVSNLCNSSFITEISILLTIKNQSLRHYCCFVLHRLHFSDN